MTPFKEGIRDFNVGQLINPYNSDTYRSREWERGSNTAYFKNLKRITRATENEA